MAQYYSLVFHIPERIGVMSHTTHIVDGLRSKFASRGNELRARAQSYRRCAEQALKARKDEMAQEEVIRAKQVKAFDQLLSRAVRGIRNLISFATYPEIHEMLKQYMYAREFDRFDDGLTVFRVCEPTTYIEDDDDEEAHREDGYVCDVFLTDMSVVLRWWVDTGSFHDTLCTFVLEIPFTSSVHEIREFLTDGRCLVSPDGKKYDGRDFELFKFNQFKVQPNYYQSKCNLIDISTLPQQEIMDTNILLQAFLLECASSKKFDTIIDHATAGWGKEAEWHYDYRKYVNVLPQDIQAVRAAIACEWVPYGARWIARESTLLND